MDPKLYFITGVCGAGKSSVLPHLKQMLPSDGFDVRDFDSRGVPDNATREGWRFPETKHWMAVANENAKKGITTSIAFAKISKPAAWLLVPYMLWVSFAVYLNHAIWTLN